METQAGKFSIRCPICNVKNNYNIAANEIFWLKEKKSRKLQQSHECHNCNSTIIGEIFANKKGIEHHISSTIDGTTLSSLSMANNEIINKVKSLEKQHTIVTHLPSKVISSSNTSFVLLIYEGNVTELGIIEILAELLETRNITTTFIAKPIYMQSKSIAASHSVTMDLIGKADVIVSVFSANDEEAGDLIAIHDEALKNNIGIAVTLNDYYLPDFTSKRNFFAVENFKEAELDYFPIVNEIENIISQKSVVQSSSLKSQTDEVENQFFENTPIAAIIDNNGKIGAADTPLGTPPIHIHPIDLVMRVNSQKYLSKSVIGEIKEGGTNIDHRILIKLEQYDDAIGCKELLWYQMFDIIEGLNYLIGFEIESAWPGSSYISVKRLIQRNAELQLLVQPKQLDNSIKDHQQIIPVEHNTFLSDVEEVGKQLQSINKNPELSEIFNRSGRVVISNSVVNINSTLNNVSLNPQKEIERKTKLGKSVENIAGYFQTVLIEILKTTLAQSTIGILLTAEITAVVNKIISMAL